MPSAGDPPNVDHLPVPVRGATCAREARVVREYVARVGEDHVARYAP